MVRDVFKICSVALIAVYGAMAVAAVEPVEIYCTIRSNGANLNCQTMGKERRVMSADDVTNFVDAGAVAAYITLKSRKGIERTFMVDPKALHYKRLSDIKHRASISEIAKAKSDLFNDIEKKVIKTSDDLDAQAQSAELVLWDPGVTYDKAKREQRILNTELEDFRKNRDKVCTATPAFEQLSRANNKMQQTLSNIVLAWQTPGTCMASFKVFKDRDGAIDLRQLDGFPDQYKELCKNSK